MFDDLVDAFRQAVRNFKDELGRDQVPGAVDRILLAMRSEVTEAQARLHELEEGVLRARSEAAKEAAEVETCRRRERMAREIGDAETERLAAEHAGRHERRRVVLEQKAHALEEEVQIRRSEVQEMMDGIRQAEKQRGTLSATAGRTQARERVQGNELFDELDRMVDQMGGGDEADADARPSAEELLDDLDREIERGAAGRRGAGPDLDARLAELKRRMGRE